MPAQEMVSIGCKLPAGLVIELREPPGIHKAAYGDTAIPGALKEAHTLTGSAMQRRVESDGVPLVEVPNVVGGYGITQVPKDFAEAWFTENANYAPVKNGQVIVWKSLVGAKSMAAERGGDIVSGLEPMDPKKKHTMGKYAVVETRSDEDD